MSQQFFSTLALAQEAIGLSLWMEKEIASAILAGALKQRGRGQTAFSFSQKSSSIHQRPLWALVIHVSELLYTIWQVM